MAITVTKLVSDVELAVNGGSISDDSSLEKSQIKFWLSYYLNMFVAEECNSKINKSEQIPSVYIVRTALEVPSLEELDGVSESDERIYVEITEPLTLNKDGGILLVQTEEMDEIKKTDIQTMQLFKNLRFSKPSENNLLYYRSGNRLYLCGFKAVDIPFNEILIDYVPRQDLLEMEDDDEVLVSDLILPNVIEAAVQAGKRMLYGSQEDTSNNGTDVKAQQYHTAIANPTKD